MRFLPRNRFSGALPGQIRADTIVAADVTAYQNYMASTDSGGNGPGLFILGDNYWCDSCGVGLEADGFITRMETMHLMWNAVAAAPIAGSNIFKIGAISDTGGASGVNDYLMETDFNNLSASNFTTEYSGYMNIGDIASGIEFSDQNSN